jgi:hypothetical protein
MRCAGREPTVYERKVEASNLSPRTKDEVDILIVVTSACDFVRSAMPAFPSVSLPFAWVHPLTEK